MLLSSCLYCSDKKSATILKMASGYIAHEDGHGLCNLEAKEMWGCALVSWVARVMVPASWIAVWHTDPHICWF